MKVLFTTGEALPFIKTGGLADVMGALPKKLAEKGLEVSIVLPYYRSINARYGAELKQCAEFDTYLGRKQIPVRLFKTVRDNVTYYFIENREYFERDECYGYDDDHVRFAFFQSAVCSMMGALNYFPDIIHNNDWQTGMIPFLCRSRSDERYYRIKQVFMIHNIAFQGTFGKDTLALFNVGMDRYNDGSLRMNDGISYMKAGIVFADKVMTVSNTYAQEILTPEFGMGLESVLELRRYDLLGVVNGIDTHVWDPAKDKALAKNYSLHNYLSGKKANKLALQKELGLKEDENVMLVGLVSRLTWQKGIYLIGEVNEYLMQQNVQLVVLGTGENAAEDLFRYMQGRFPGRVCFYRGYNEELAHRIYAASDLFLMPSKYEPCGISQMNAMRYGCLPLVRETGGLKDTVKPYNKYTKEGTGFSFTNFASHELLTVFNLAADVYYHHRNDWKQLVRQAMTEDVSWEHSADRYIEIYGWLV